MMRSYLCERRVTLEYMNGEVLEVTGVVDTMVLYMLSSWFWEIGTEGTIRCTWNEKGDCVNILTSVTLKNRSNQKSRGYVMSPC